MRYHHISPVRHWKHCGLVVAVLALLQSVATATEAVRDPETDACGHVLSYKSPNIDKERAFAEHCVRHCKAVLDDPGHKRDQFAEMCALKRQSNGSRPAWATI